MVRSYRRSGLLNPSPVTDLRPEVELMQTLSCLKHTALERLPSSLERNLVITNTKTKIKMKGFS